MTRNEITAKRKANFAEIRRLQEENLELLKQSYLLSDEKQWYTEEEVTIGKGKRKETFTVGFINWNEDFVDQERSRQPRQRCNYSEERRSP